MSNLSSDSLRTVVREATSGRFDVLGELCRDTRGGNYLLARGAADGRLRVLRLMRDDTDLDAHSPYTLEEIDRLDASVPRPPGPCPTCSATLFDWRRHCHACGEDVSGISPSNEIGRSQHDLDEAVRLASAGTLEPLGAIERVEGGGAVHFARDRATADLVAFELHRDTSDPTRATGVALTTVAFTPGQCVTPNMPAPLTTPAMPGRTDLPTPEGAVGAGASKLCPLCGTRFALDVKFCPSDGSSLLAVDTEDPLLGQIIADRYHLTKKLGEGGMGVVYLAEHVKMRRKCAVKVMHPSLARDPDSFRRFNREATNASLIEHRSVAAIHDFGETKDGLLYIAMEYIPGEPLSRMLKGGRRIPIERAVRIAAQVADALQAAQDLEHPLVHRDLKPDNIMVVVGRDGRDTAKVVDFGIAKAMHSNSDQLTQAGVVVGTPEYMSPEQIVADPVDGRSDVYSLGCVLYQMLTGEKAFAAPTREGTIARRLSELPARPSMRNPAVPDELDEIVVKSLARKPAARFQTAGEFRDALLDLEHLGSWGTGDRMGKRTPVRASRIPDTADEEAPGTPPRGRQATDRDAGTFADRRALAEEDTESIDAPAPGAEPIRTARRDHARLGRMAGAGVVVVALGGAVWFASRVRSTGLPAGETGVPAPDSRVARLDTGVDTGQAAVTSEVDLGVAALQPDTLERSAPVGGRSVAPPARDTVALLRIGTTLPEGATLTLDGRSTRASQAVRVSPGAHTIAMRARGFVGRDTTFTSTPGKPFTWAPELVRQVTRVDVRLADRALTVGDSTRLTVAALGADGDAILDRPVAWRAMDPAVADLNAARTYVLAKGPGVATVEATVDGVPQRASVTVAAPKPPPVAPVVVAPAPVAPKPAPSRGNALTDVMLEQVDRDLRAFVANLRAERSLIEATGPMRETRRRLLDLLDQRDSEIRARDLTRVGEPELVGSGGESLVTARFRVSIAWRDSWNRPIEGRPLTLLGQFVREGDTLRLRRVFIESGTLK
ncbi:MAG: serine/threonine-protein kinase [Gemmatimonadaceae bacterium]